MTNYTAYRGCTSDLPVKIGGSNHNSAGMHDDANIIINKLCDVSIQSPNFLENIGCVASYTSRKVGSIMRSNLYIK